MFFFASRVDRVKRMQTKAYSNKDKAVLQKIHAFLESSYIPTTFAVSGGSRHAKRTGTNRQSNARQGVYGMVKWRKRDVQPSNLAKRYPDFLPLCYELMQSHLPEFEFDMVYVNKNTVCQRHLDKNNNADSVIIGFGEYQGGLTCVELADGTVEKHDISKKSLKFNGSKNYHWSEEFTGVRYSLVFFKNVNPF